MDNTARVWDAETGKELRRLDGHAAGITAAGFSPDGKRIVTGSKDKTVRIWDADSGRELCLLVGFTGGAWAVVDPDGRYDASDGGDVDGLHWVVGNEPIALAQFKERYYDPGLLAKHLGFSKEPLREVGGFADPKLFPAVEMTGPTADEPKLIVRLTDRGGGIGRVVVKLSTARR